MASRTVTLTGRVTDAAGHIATTTTTLTVASSMLLGMDAPVGSAWNQAVIDYPGIRYTRDFGKDNLYLPADADTLTEPTVYGTDKFTSLPAGAVMHLSWKDDPALLTNWLNALPTLPANHPGFYVSPWHEPRDDVDAGTFTTAQFRAWGTQMANIIASHPKGSYIKGNGPVLTRFDLDEQNVDPTAYGYAGMTHYGIDCYHQDTSAYYTTTKMFGTVFAKVKAAYPTIRFLVPEMGLCRITSDTTGSGRAAKLREYVAYLQGRGDVDAAAYFNAAGSIPCVPFTPTSPEGIAYKELLAAQ